LQGVCNTLDDILLTNNSHDSILPN